jgi:cytoskeletal protein CcmA (bactofilin family)
MLRKDIFGGSSQVDHADRLNKIVAGTEINGDLTSDSNIQLEGEVNGNVSCAGRVVIGSSGKITARIKGDIQTMKLHIEEGAFFEGACVMRAGVSAPKLDSEPAFDE